jgi:hypothetical protein
MSSVISTKKKSLKEEIMDEITKKLMKKLQGMVNHKIHDALKIIKTLRVKKFEKTQKQLNKLREDFQKHQHETKDTIKRDV